MSKLNGLLTLMFPGTNTRVRASFNVGKTAFVSEEYVKEKCVTKEDSLTLKGIKEDGTEVEFTIYGDQL